MSADTIGAEELRTLPARTLRAAGYQILEFQPTNDVVEIRCRIPSRFGSLIDFQFVFTSRNEFSTLEIDDLAFSAKSKGLTLVCVSQAGGVCQISWGEFSRVLGGAVPSWRALESTYRSALLVASRNRTPPGQRGEAWLLFEELVADGLQFVLGRRVLRRGGLRRGLRVSDMIAQLPNFELLVVDAKAAGEGFDASFPNLRALVEYTNDTKQAQAGNAVVGAVVVSSVFKQDTQAIQEVSHEFFSYTRTPVTFVEAETLADVVESLSRIPSLRNGVRWQRLFAGGLLTSAIARKLLNTAEMLRVESREV